jgi:hypothetical protein
MNDGLIWRYSLVEDEKSPVDMDRRPCLSIQPKTAVRKSDPITLEEHGRKPNGNKQPASPI